jgi:hypothetical protein
MAIVVKMPPQRTKITTRIARESNFPSASSSPSEKPLPRSLKIPGKAILEDRIYLGAIYYGLS